MMNQSMLHIVIAMKEIESDDSNITWTARILRIVCLRKRMKRLSHIETGAF